MIHIPLSMFIPLPPKKFSALHVHQFGKVLTNVLPDFTANHLKNILRLLLDFLENAHNLWFANFDLHGSSPFFLVFSGKPFIQP